MVALAHQCFLNEYVYIESREETCKVQQLAEQINNGSANIFQVLLYACYRPLFTSGNDGNSIASLFDNAGDLVQEVWRRQIVEPLYERKLKSKIERLTVINNQTSLAVQQQYEENPYPRWLVTDKPHKTTLTSYLKNLFPGLPEKYETLLDEPDILVAGCGTGLQPVRNARRFAYKKITAIDLSLSSLAYGMRKAEELELNNIHFKQADITELHDHDERYDFIECFGVLHHLQDPYVGWQILVNLLNTGGVMRIGLYSDQARKAVVAARQFIEERGYKPLPEDIRHCRQAIFALPEEHPVSVLWDSPDFYTTSECRDLIFHVQEHRLGLRQINDYLQQLGLQFIGFEFPDFHTIRRYGDKYPDDQDAIDLGLWDEFESEHPDTFASQYVFWCRKQ
jgi:2-polyprenyl-3-methyl-5-hydroxy-6-metoxy-1,4-benzoquinol methylase